MTNGNDPAFIDSMGEGFKLGMTKREYFAAMAMTGLLAKTPWAMRCDEIGRNARDFADALIFALNEEKK